MGIGSSSANRPVWTVKELAKIAQTLRQFCESVSVNIEETDVTILAKLAQKVQHEENETILIKGEPATGLYILMSGEVHTRSEVNDITISVLQPGDVFGEVSALFAVPNPTNIVSHSSSECAFLSMQLISGTGRFQEPGVSLKKWFLSRRYLDTGELIGVSDHNRDMVLNALNQIPLFESWPVEARHILLSQIEPQKQIILYPSSAAVLIKTDPANEVAIVLKGKVVVYDDRNKINLEATAERALCLGEEGLFGTVQRAVTIRADGPCLITILRKELFLLPIREAIRDTWKTASARWSKFRKRRSQEDYIRFAVYMQIETVMKQLEEIDTLRGGGCQFIYTLAMFSTWRQFKSRSVILLGEEMSCTVVLVLYGVCRVFTWDRNTLFVVDTGHIYVAPDSMPRGTSLRASNDCKILIFTAENFNKIKSMFPEMDTCISNAVAKPSQ